MTYMHFDHNQINKENCIFATQPEEYWHFNSRLHLHSSENSVFSFQSLDMPNRVMLFTVYSTLGQNSASFTKQTNDK